MDPNYLEFEQPIAELEAKISELRLVGSDNELNINEEIQNLKLKSNKLTEKIYSNLSPWQVSQVARHPLRPYTLDYIEHIFTDFDELHGDRLFADDLALIDVRRGQNPLQGNDGEVGHRDLVAITLKPNGFDGVCADFHAPSSLLTSHVL